MSLKSITKAAFRALGLEVHSLKHGTPFFKDAFLDQERILAGREVRCILDVGANSGMTAARYRKHFPGAFIHCFEPVDENFSALKHFTAKDAKMQAHRLAVTDQSGKIDLHLTEDPFTHSVFPNAGAFKNRGIIQVDAVCLDDFCCQQGMETVSILKMDIQGGELLALKGASGLLERQAIDLIYTEASFTFFYQGQAMFGDICPWLEQKGYDLFGFYDQAHWNGKLGWVDALFVPRRKSGAPASLSGVLI